jgi:hypothetical protein
VLDVSVPCPKCDAPLRFGERWCTGCGEHVGRKVRRRLAERLEATGGDFAEMRRNVTAASNLLIVLGSLQLVWALGILVAGDPEARVAWFVGAVGAGMLAAAYFVNDYPRMTVIVVFASFCLINLVALFVAPLYLLEGWVMKIAVILFLGRALLSAHHAEELRRTLVGGSDERRGTWSA